MPEQSGALEELTSLSGKIVSDKHYRDALIMKSFSEGATLRVIASAAGLTHQGIAKIIKRKMGD